MGRRRVIQPSQIIQSTLMVLSTRGVEAVTIAQIAQQAGISEASIYKFFSSKEELLRACVSESVAPHDFWRRLIAQSATRSVRELLEDAALYTIRYYKQNLPTLLLRVLRPQSADCCSGPLQTLDLQTLYFQSEIDRGRIRLSDPKRLAIAFCGALFYHVFAAQAFGGGEAALQAAHDNFARAWVQDFWLSLKPESP